MFKIFKNVIENSDFDLRDILKKIEESYIKSDISEEEKTNLEELAREKAKPENSYASLQEQIDELAERILKIEEALKEDSSDGEEGTTEEYPEYVQPTGAHNAYKIGDKVTFKGEKYTCNINSCVWSPETYPKAWIKVVA